MKGLINLHQICHNIPQRYKELIMIPLPEEVVVETAKEFSGLTPQQLSDETEDISISQPGILSFITEFTEDLDTGIRDLTIYIFIVIYSMFEAGYGDNIEEISFEETIESYENNAALMDRMNGSNDRIYQNMAKVQMSAQPYVIKYVVETLYNASQAEDPVLFSEEDMSYLFLLLKSIIDVLNRKTDA